MKNVCMIVCAVVSLLIFGACSNEGPTVFDDGGFVEDGGMMADSSVDPSDGSFELGDSGLSAIGSECEDRDECESGVCLTPQSENEGGLCLPKPEFGSCSAHSDCPHDEFCCTWHNEETNRYAGFFCLHRFSVIECGPQE